MCWVVALNARPRVPGLEIRVNYLIAKAAAGSALLGSAPGQSCCSVVDLAVLTFIDSSGVAARTRAQAQVRHAGGVLLLAACRSHRAAAPDTACPFLDRHDRCLRCVRQCRGRDSSGIAVLAGASRRTRPSGGAPDALAAGRSAGPADLALVPELAPVLMWPPWRWRCQPQCGAYCLG